MHNTDGSEDPTYYTYNAHTDVQAITDATGNTKATYGYTAYGADDVSQDTGVDKNTGNGATGTTTANPYNVYRFNAKRIDTDTANYDMGFRTYDPGLNRFLTRDMYEGAFADTRMTADPYTGNRYAFADGNPLSNIELDGHCSEDQGMDIGCGARSQDPIPVAERAQEQQARQANAPAPAAVDLRFGGVRVTAANWGVYTDAFLATQQAWTAQGFHAPTSECIDATNYCMGSGWLDVGYFREQLCKQPGIVCPGHAPTPAEQGFGAGAQSGMIFGGKDGGLYGPGGRDGGAPSEGTSGLSARSAMDSMLAQGIHCGTDCSEIAEDLYNAAGKTGDILRVEPAEPGPNLTVTEGGQQVNYMYHEVYTDGSHVFDPRFGPDPIPIQEWETTIMGDNPGATIRTVTP